MRNMKSVGCSLRLLMVCMAVVSTLDSEEAINLGGSVAKGAKELAASIAEQRAAEAKATEEANARANREMLSLIPSATRGGSQLPTSAEPAASGSGSLSGSNAANSDSSPSLNSSLANDPKAMIDRYAEEYEALRRKIHASTKNYDGLEQSQKDAIKQDLQEAANRTSTLELLRQKYPDLVDKKYETESDNLKHHLMDGAKAAYASLSGSSDESFVKSVDEAQGNQQEASASNSQSTVSQASSSSDGASSGDSGISGANEGRAVQSPELSPSEAVYAACSKNIGGRDGGPTLLQHLTSGECAESLAKHSEYSKDYGVKKIARLLKEWQTLGRNSANLKIGIQRLVDFGIFVYPSLTQAQVPADVPRAVEIQQEQKAASPGSSSDFKSPAANTQSPKATSSEGAILNSQRATD